MKLSRFIDDAYQGASPAKRRAVRKEKLIFSLEDLADQVGSRPGMACVKELVPDDLNQMRMLVSASPGREHSILWGLLSSLIAERSNEPVSLPGLDYAGLELRRGCILLPEAADHVGEKMSGGRIIVSGGAGTYLGQEMTGGGIIAKSCADYAFRNMKAGFGLIRGDAGKFAGIGNSGGRIVVQGSCKERAGWLMHSGSLYVRGDAGEYLGLLMSGGRIKVLGEAGRRAGWRKRGGLIAAGSFGPESADDVMILGE